MESFLVDTTFWVARFNALDRDHAAAMRFLEEVRGRRRPPYRPVITDYVFDEVVTTLLTRTRRHDIAAEAGRALRQSPGLRMIRILARDFDEAWELFLERGDKQWSFTDCTSFTVMDREGMRTALSFDPNFTQAGFARLP